MILNYFENCNIENLFENNSINSCIYFTEKHPFAWPRFGVATVIFRVCKHESIYTILSINTGQLNLERQNK